MSDVSKEKRNKIAQEIGWTPRRIQGYVDGRFYHRSGHDMPGWHKVDMDEYSKGFRTGYYEQDDQLSAADIQKQSSAR